MYISYAKILMENQYINQHIKLQNITIFPKLQTYRTCTHPMFWFSISQIIISDISGSSDLMFCNKEHSILLFSIDGFPIFDNFDSVNPMSYVFQQDTPYVPIFDSPVPICDISDLESFFFSNKQMSKFLIPVCDAQLLETGKLRFWGFILTVRIIFT